MLKLFLQIKNPHKGVIILGKNGFVKFFTVILVGLIFVIPEHCYAMYGDSATLPWSGPLVKLRDNLGGPVAKIMAIVAVTMSGVMLMFGEMGGMAKRGIQLVFGISLALNAIGGDGWIAKVIVGDYALGSSAIVPVTVPLISAKNFLDTFLVFILQLCLNGAVKVHAYVFNFMILLASIDVVMKLIFSFEQSDPISFVFKETLRIGFFVFLLQDWMIGGIIFDPGGIVGVAFRSFAELGLLAGSTSTTATLTDVTLGNAMSVFSVSKISGAIIKLVANAMVGIAHFQLTSLGVLLMTLVCAIAIIAAGFLIAAEIFISVVEFWIISLVSMPLIGFGLLAQTKFLFEKATGALFSQGVKIMVVKFIAQFSSDLFVTAAGGVGQLNGNVNLPELLNLVLAALTVYLLVKKVPDLAQGLLSGQPNLSGSAVTGAIKEGVQMAIGTKGADGSRQGGLVGAAKSAVTGGASGAAGAVGIGKALLDGVGRGQGGLGKIATNAGNMAVGGGKELFNAAKGKVSDAKGFVSDAHASGYIKADDMRITGEQTVSSFAQAYQHATTNNAKSDNVEKNSKDMKFA